MVTDKQIRKLKIHTKLTGNKSISVEKSEVILSGLWLEKCGFTPGKIINVEASPGQLVITLAEQD